MKLLKQMIKNEKKVGTKQKAKHFFFDTKTHIEIKEPVLICDDQSV